jgi:hypothetical protein
VTETIQAFGLGGGLGFGRARGKPRPDSFHQGHQQLFETSQETHNFILIQRTAAFFGFDFANR